mmetsp:Transcript_60023/g.135742  ORF Transcript_60023/g.135742 Transcript_60023/m.135742 type:complete len:339 (-) Transcript_60023:364-1380(-)
MGLSHTKTSFQRRAGHRSLLIFLLLGCLETGLLPGIQFPPRAHAFAPFPKLAQFSPRAHSRKAPLRRLFVVAAGKRRSNPEDEAMERLKKLEDIMLRVVAQQAEKLKNLEDSVDSLRSEVEGLKEMLDESIRDSAPGVSPSGSEEALADLADMLAASASPSGARPSQETKLDSMTEAAAEAAAETSMEDRTREARLQEALDVPHDLYDAADASGAALLAAILLGRRRMVVEINDPLLEVQPGPLERGEGASERLARFIELMTLPVMAALEGIANLDRTRVHIMFRVQGSKQGLGLFSSPLLGLRPPPLPWWVAGRSFVHALARWSLCSRFGSSRRRGG